MPWSICRILSLQARFFSCAFITLDCCRDFELFYVLPCSSSPDNGVSFGSIPVYLHVSDIIFAVRSRKSLYRMYISHLFCNSYCAEYQIYYCMDKMLVDCMFSQLFRSLIKSQSCYIDNSNPNSVIGSTVNQFETPLRVDISTRHFSLSFISVVNLSTTFLYFSSIDFFISFLSFFQLSSVISYRKLF